MSVRRVADSGFALPPNPSYIDFARSDGNASTWPTNTTRVVDSEGHVNFYQYLDLDHSQNKKWRVSVGDAVSLKLKMPDGPKYVLRDFPTHYRLYDHNKGPANAPRHDLYLFGPVKKRFRSINEFIPHAIWLMGDEAIECECKYCAKKTQREVTASISNILRTNTQSPGPTRPKVVREKGKGRDPATRLKEARQRDNRVYAAVQHTVEPLKPSANVLKQPMLVERSNDLRGVLSKAASHMPRWFREGEVVWCALNPPIHSEEYNTDIEYWPAIVEEAVVKSVSKPLTSALDTNSSSHASTSARPLDSTESDNERGPMLSPSTVPVPWTIHQTTRYKLQLLAVSHSVVADSADILAYQVYMPPYEVLELMKHFPFDQLVFNKDLMTKFNPYPAEGNVASIVDAIPPYTYALQLAASLSTYWCLTDEYELKYSIPTTISKAPEAPSSPPTSISTHRPSTSQPQPQPPRTLQEVIESASRHNSDLSKATKSYYDKVAEVRADSSGPSTKKTATHVLGVPPATEQLSQIRYQGLWWGAERIWVGDFIRLKIARRSLETTADNHILPPAGPGKGAREAWLDSTRDIAELGAGMRGVFLKLDGIMAVNVPTSNGYNREARAVGMAYELVDEDWDDPSIPKSSDSPSVAISHPPPSALHDASKPPYIAETTTAGPPLPLSLPPPPAGYKFRPIIEPGYEFVCAMGLVGGRYYPGILTHPRVQSTVVRALTQGLLEESTNLWALEGLSGGVYNAVDPYLYKKSRLVMLQDADKQAQSDLEEYKQKRLSEGQAGPSTKAVDESMDIDDIYS